MKAEISNEEKQNEGISNIYRPKYNVNKIYIVLKFWKNNVNKQVFVNWNTSQSNVVLNWVGIECQ